MEKTKKLMIDQSLFTDLCIYAVQNADLNDPRYLRIEKGIRDKLEAMARHELYTQYKSGATEEERDMARMKYLEKVGIPLSFQWLAAQDANVTRKPLAGPE